jgi:site-specific DNA-methyltransferase (adenine-specific)
LARKPLIGTVAANVLAYGTGALNIDGTRVGLDGAEQHATPARSGLGANGIYGASTIEYVPTNDVLPRYNLGGRWPANLILDEEAAALLDAQTGERPVSGAAQNGRPAIAENEGMFSPGPGNGTLHADSGGASRFFYTAKASRSEREAGLEHLTVGGSGLFDDDAYREDGERRANHTGRGARRNQHPTVKPVDLMAWLVRLVTPPGGLVLDPFLGSGSTGMAALDEGMRFVGFDLDPDYVALARNRIAHRHVLVPPPPPESAGVPQPRLL